MAECAFVLVSVRGSEEYSPVAVFPNEEAMREWAQDQAVKWDYYQSVHWPANESSFWIGGTKYWFNTIKGVGF